MLFAMAVPSILVAVMAGGVLEKYLLLLKWEANVLRSTKGLMVVEGLTTPQRPTRRCQTLPRGWRRFNLGLAETSNEAEAPCRERDRGKRAIDPEENA